MITPRFNSARSKPSHSIRGTPRPYYLAQAQEALARTAQTVNGNPMRV